MSELAKSSRAARIAKQKRYNEQKRKKQQPAEYDQGMIPGQVPDDLAPVAQASYAQAPYSQASYAQVSRDQAPGDRDFSDQPHLYQDRLDQSRRDQKYKGQVLRQEAIYRIANDVQPDPRAVIYRANRREALREEALRKQSSRNPINRQDGDSAAALRKFEGYNMNKDTWITPSENVIKKMASLKKSLITLSEYKGLHEEDRKDVREMEAAIRQVMSLGPGKNNTWPPELLNDLFFLAARRADTVLTGTHADTIGETCGQLNYELFEDSQFTHRIDAAFFTSHLGRDWDGKTLPKAKPEDRDGKGVSENRKNRDLRHMSDVDPSNIILNGVAFPSSQSENADHRKIAEFRDKEIEKINTVYTDMEKEFKGTNRGKEVLRSVEILKDRLEELKSSTTPGEMNRQMKLLRLAIIKTTAECQKYMARSDNKLRKLLCDQMLTRMDFLNTPNSMIHTDTVQRNIDDINDMIGQLRGLLSESDQKDLQAILEDYFFNASPEAVATSSADVKQLIQDMFNGVIGHKIEDLDTEIKLQEAILKGVDKAKGGAKAARETLKAATQSRAALEKVVTGHFEQLASVSKIVGSEFAVVFGDLPRLASNIETIVKKNTPSRRDVLNTTESIANLTKNVFGISQGALQLSGNASEAAVNATGGVSAVLGAGIAAGYIINGGWAFVNSIKRIRRIDQIKKGYKTADADDQDPALDGVLNGIKARARKKAIRAFARAAGGAITVTGSAVSIAVTGGAVIPALVAPLMGGAGALLGATVSIEKAASHNEKEKNNMLGAARKQLTENITELMGRLLEKGHESQAEQIALSLTNSKAKAHLMVAGCRNNSTPNEQVIAKSLMMEKLKTW